MSAKRAHGTSTSIHALVGIVPAGGSQLEHPARCLRIRPRHDSVLSAHIGTAFQGSRRTYGSPRVRAELAGQGLRTSKRRVERLMRQSGLYALRKRRFTRTTESKHALPIAPNLLARDFTASAPNRVWVTDISAPQQAA